MENPMLELAQKLSAEHDGSDQDLADLWATAERCLEFSTAQEKFRPKAIQRGELFGLVLTSYQHYLENNPRNPIIEKNLQRMSKLWEFEPWAAEQLKSGTKF